VRAAELLGQRFDLRGGPAGQDRSFTPFGGQSRHELAGVAAGSVHHPRHTESMANLAAGYHSVASVKSRSAIAMSYG